MAAATVRYTDANNNRLSPGQLARIHRARRTCAGLGVLAAKLEDMPDLDCRVVDARHRDWHRPPPRCVKWQRPVPRDRPNSARRGARRRIRATEEIRQGGHDVIKLMIDFPRADRAEKPCRGIESLLDLALISRRTAKPSRQALRARRIEHVVAANGKARPDRRGRAPPTRACA